MGENIQKCQLDEEITKGKNSKEWYKIEKKTEVMKTNLVRQCKLRIDSDLSFDFVMKISFIYWRDYVTYVEFRVFAFESYILPDSLSNHRWVSTVYKSVTQWLKIYRNY